MDFNIYDFHGNPRPIKQKEEQWCTTCLMYTPTNQHLGTCDICGEEKSNKAVKPTEKSSAA